VLNVAGKANGRSELFAQETIVVHSENEKYTLPFGKSRLFTFA